MLQSRRHGLHLHHHVLVVGGQGVGVGRVGRLLLGHLLLPESHLVVLVSHLEVVGNSWSVPSAGWELVVVRPMRLEQLQDVQVLPFDGNCHWGSVQVVGDSGVDKDVQKMAGALGGSLSAGQEQRRLTLESGGQGSNQHTLLN